MSARDVRSTETTLLISNPTKNIFSGYTILIMAFYIN